MLTKGSVKHYVPYVGKWMINRKYYNLSIFCEMANPSYVYWSVRESQNSQCLYTVHTGSWVSELSKFAKAFIPLLGKAANFRRQRYVGTVRVFTSTVITEHSIACCQYVSHALVLNITWPVRWCAKYGRRNPAVYATGMRTNQNLQIYGLLNVADY